jgi:hypothetical protein
MVSRSVIVLFICGDGFSNRSVGNMGLTKVFSDFDAAFASRASSMEPQADGPIVDAQGSQQTQEAAVASDKDVTSN